MKVSFKMLTMAQRRLLRRAGAAADALKVSAFLVGGPVRDLLLGRAAGDLDIAVEGEAGALARVLAQTDNGRVTLHPHFGTAKIVWPGGATLDIAATRTETYAAPAALPRVAWAAVAEDLARRDFSVNAMAVRLNGSGTGAVLDFHGGRRDLALNYLRVLHPRSFEDDPTRIFRAVRFACRLGFRWEPQTRAWALRAVRAGLLRRLSPARLAHELDLLWREPDPYACLAGLGRLGALESLQPGLKPIPAALTQKLERVLAETSPKYKECLDPVQVKRLAWLAPLTLAQTRRLLAKVAWPSCVREGLLWQKQKQDFLLRRLKTDARSPMSFWSGLLASWPLENLIWLSIRPQAAPGIHAYLERRDRVRPILTGSDLTAMGFSPGPGMGRVLKSLEHAHWDGLPATRAQEMQYVQKITNEVRNHRGHREK